MKKWYWDKHGNEYEWYESNTGMNWEKYVWKMKWCVCRFERKPLFFSTYFFFHILACVLCTNEQCINNISPHYALLIHHSYHCSWNSKHTWNIPKSPRIFKMTIKYDCNEGCLFNVPNLKWLKMKTIIIEGDKHLIKEYICQR